MAVACAIVLSTLGCAVDQASPDSDPLSEADEGASSPPEPPEDAAESPLEPDQLGSPQCGTDLVADRSLYFNDTEAMRSEDADSPFALRRALEAIIATSAYPFQSPEELLQSMEVKLGYVLVALALGVGASAGYVAVELFRDSRRVRSRG